MREEQKTWLRYFTMQKKMALKNKKADRKHHKSPQNQLLIFG